MKSIAAGDGDRELGTPLTRYYQQAGTPPGFWLGSGLPGLGSGDGRDVVAGDVVEEIQMRRLMGEGADPVTGEQLGTPYLRFKTFPERVDARVAKLGAALTDAERAGTASIIEVEERKRRTKRAVAGYDYTFSVPKSVSVLWGLVDAGTQALIVQAHHQAVGEVLDLMERQVAATRTGKGGIIQVHTRGLIAAAFDHPDSRAGDPQLHTHVVVANKVQGPDGKWRTLDGRPMHAAVVALSEYYNGVLADRLTETLGIVWRPRGRGGDRNPSWEVAGVADALVAGFSQRTAGIETEVARLIADYVANHGRQPSRRMLIELRQRATLENRPDKELRSLADLTIEWRERATQMLGEDAATWAQHVLTSQTSPDRQERPVVLRADDLSAADVGAVAAVVVQTVSTKRSTWRRWNLHAEASRQTAGLRFATAADRERTVERIIAAAQDASLRLTPPELAATPGQFRRVDGTSVFRPAHHVVSSSEQMLAAEDRLLAAARHAGAPALEMGDWGRDYRHRAQRLGGDQRHVIELVACSGRSLDVLVGPAGAGKTTTLGALRAAWEHEYGVNSVVGLAPSAAADQVLAHDLGIACENTAKWLYEHAVGNWDLTAGQMLVVDEASLAGTLALDHLVQHAREAGAKVLLVGDWAQLTAVEAGGAFGLVARDIGATDTLPELTDVRRLTQPWEKTASLSLRRGNPECLTAYDDHGRIHGGAYDDILESAYQAWRTDHAAGLTTVLIADTLTVVSDLNARARNDLIIAGTVEPGGTRLADGNHASVGDTVITRHNDRHLRVGNGRTWVKNGDRWRVTAVDSDGSLTVHRLGGRGGAVILPAAYTATHVDLGYAITAHRAQGSTVDAAHVLVASETMTREAFYVSMTRGRHANTAWVATDAAGLGSEVETHQHTPDGPPTALDVLADILARSGRELSAHETITAEQAQWSTIAHLADQYDIIARAATAERWNTLITTSRLDPEQTQELLSADSLAGLIDTLRHVEANGHDPARLLDRAITAGHLASARDLAAVLSTRVTALTANRRRGSVAAPERRLIAGLIPTVDGSLPDDMHHALDELAGAIEQRADALTQIALAEQAPWIRHLGPQPAASTRREEWLQQVRVILACADRHGLRPDHVLQSATREGDRALRRDLSLARTAARRAAGLAALAGPVELSSPAVEHQAPSRRL